MTGNRSLNPVFWSAAILVAATIAIAYTASVMSARSKDAMTRQVQALEELLNFGTTLKDAETGQRGYLLTGEDRYLEPYRDGLAKIQRRLAALQNLAAAGEISKSKADEVAQLTQQKLDELARTILLRQEKGLDAAVAEVRTDRGLKLMDRIRTDLGDLRSQARTELDAALHRSTGTEVVRNIILAFLGVLNLGFLWWAYRRISIEIHRRETASLESNRQKELLATTLASIGDGVIVTDAQGRATFLNKEAERLTGWKSEEAAGHPLPAVFHIIDERTKQAAANPVEKVFREGKVIGLGNHTILVSKDGVSRPIEDSAAPIRQSDGSFAGAVLVFRDATEQRRSHEANALLAAVVEHSGDAIYTKNLEGIILTWNHAAARLFRYKAEEIIGQHARTLFPADRLEEEDQVLGCLKKGQLFERFQTVRRAKDGQTVAVSVVVSPLKDEEGRVSGASTIMHDIRETVAAREALAQERDLLATTLASIGDGVIVTDAQGRVTSLNREAEKLTGWQRTEAVDRPLPEIFRIVNEETRRGVENPVDKVIRQGSTVGLANHTLLVTREGKETPIDDSAAPIRQPDGSLAGVVLVFRDATEQRRLYQTNALLATVVEHSGDAIYTKNLEGIILTWNVAAERLFGYKAEEIIGLPARTLFPDDRLNEEEQVLDCLKKGQLFERFQTLRRTKEGHTVPVSVVVSPLKDQEGRVTGASSITHDISEMVAAREALAKERDLLMTTLASIGDGVIVTDARGQVTFVNREAEALTGWQNADAAGRPLPEVFRIVNEESRQAVENPVDKVLRLGAVVGLANHTLLLARDGREIPIDDSAAPIRRAEGQLAGVVLVFRDFTELREAQRRLLQYAADLEKRVTERTVKLQDMVNELEHVSYSITHDMRAPLRAMSTFAAFLMEENKSGTPEAQQYSQRIVSAATRLDKLIQGALHYTRTILQESPLEKVDLGSLITGLIETYPNLGRDAADIDFDGPLPTVLGNEALLTQCFSNLLGNAVKFVPPGIRPRVHVRAETNTRTTRIWVEDNGIGIPRESQARLFKMFERLTHHYDGSGIGLAVVRKVVEKMGGKVGVESEEGKGSRFWVDLQVPAPCY